MDETERLMSIDMNLNRLLLTIALLAISVSAQAQLQYRWTPVRMDSAWDEMKDTKATEIIGKYAPLVEPLQEIIGYAEDEYTKRRPDSGLSNFAVDVIREVAQEMCGSHVDVALTNFGGIRTSLPKGAVRVYDIYSIFPFNNQIVWFDIIGSDLKKFFEKQAAVRVEALSNVKFVIKDRKIESLLIGGEPLDENRMYKFATLDFLMDGGDGIQLKDMAVNYTTSGVWLRDALVDYIRKMTAEGKTLDLHPDGRTVIITDHNQQ
jgi:5''-nucleotidase/2'',3''-cyclic phosphodiesterase and related esterases